MSSDEKNVQKNVSLPEERLVNRVDEIEDNLIILEGRLDEIKENLEEIKEIVKKQEDKFDEIKENVKKLAIHLVCNI